MIDTLKVTKKFLFKEFHRIAKERGVKLNIKTMARGGEYCSVENLININRDSRKQTLPFIFFHELGHLYCVNNNIWETYHNYNNTWNSFKSTALKAEKWIDSWAEKEVNKYFKNVDSYKAYHTIEGVQYLKKLINTTEYNYWILKNKKKLKNR